MNLFSLSLEDDSKEWYFDLDDDSYKTLSEFQDSFRNKWGEKCHVPMPPTDVEDATQPLNNWAKSPMNM